MKNKFKLIILISVIFIIFITGFIYAYKMNNIDIINIIKIGKIDINLNIYENDNGKDIKLIDNKYITSNTEISYIPVISKTNSSGDCYVRLKINLYNSEGTEETLSKDSFINLNEDCVYINGYIYYKNILTDSVRMFEGIKINNSEKYKVEVKAEAIQSKNFTVDFNSNTPWGDISEEDIIEAIEE